jgi:hypothetical protein
MLYYFLLLHWIGDFVFQSNKMAVQKSKDLSFLSLHVIVYILTLAIGIGLYYLVFTPPIFTIQGIAGFLLFNLLAHFITDFFTSKLSTYYNKEKRRHAFFVVIGFDQLIHIVTIVFTTQTYLQ